ncbi:MAG: hypothetical protein IT457_12500 [Planctomycetes bacterium]|jgi:hypothetical protein|nr:hypothetical protein [Planctomycetota bacterium]
MNGEDSQPWSEEDDEEGEEYEEYEGDSEDEEEQLFDLEDEEFEARLRKDGEGYTPLEAAILLTQMVRYRMHDVAAIMHLSGLFDVSERAVTLLLTDYGESTLDAVFGAVGPNFATLADLAPKVEGAWMLYGALDHQRRRWKPRGAEQRKEAMPTPLRNCIERLMLIESQVSLVIEELRAVTGVTTEDVDRLFERLAQ